MGTIRHFALFIAVPLAMAQDSSSSTSGPPMPSPSDYGSTDQGKSNTVGLMNYYFVFFALIIIAAGLAAFFMVKRKRRYGAILHRQNALERDVSRWDPIAARRRAYWHRNTSSAQEEGLNEHGEAPPPYVPAPKSPNEQRGQGEVAVPMQTLSREQAGLKPPDYEETRVRPVDDESRPGTGTGTTQQTVEPRSMT